MTNPGDEAFARPDGEYCCAQDGLTKREYFAAMAMQALLSREHAPSSDIIMYLATAHADDLIEALNREVPS